MESKKLTLLHELWGAWKDGVGYNTTVKNMFGELLSILQEEEENNAKVQS